MTQPVEPKGLGGRRSGGTGMQREVGRSGWSLRFGTALNRTKALNKQLGEVLNCSPAVTSSWSPLILVVVPDGSGNICTYGRHMSLSTRCLTTWLKFMTGKSTVCRRIGNKKNKSVGRGKWSNNSCKKNHNTETLRQRGGGWMVKGEYWAVEVTATLAGMPDCPLGY